MENKFDELVSKLKEIFQLDKPELDFGIYRILHARSAEIKDFLENRLKTKVQETLKAHGAADAKGALETARQAVVNALGPTAIAADGTINSAFAATPAGQQYVAAKTAFDAVQGTLKNESEVYSHLLDFFKCYYEDGDFVSKRRYKEGKYAIPYEGEEVKLHWANADQYYTKSGENFTNYSFTVDGHSVAFKLLTAETAKDNVKDNDGERRFVLWDPAKKESLCSDIVSSVPDEESALLESLPDKFLEEKDGKLVIYFQYLKLPKAKKGATEKTDQKSLYTAAVEQIKQALMADNALALKYHKLLEPVSSDDKRLFIEKQLADYTAKNTSDYFIHKDLQGFLTRELDFYVKNELMHLDRIDEAQTIKDIEANLRIIQAFRAIALVLIDFMAQLEEFQKKLYLKKKFVTECEYCITMNRLSEELRAEVLANAKQLEEWDALGTDIDPKSKDMMAIDARMVDTRNFRQSDGSNPFKDKLLKQIDNLDDACDGLLIHADNFQALRFLQDRYAQKVKCVYIDPPYNTGSDGFLYRDAYKHSSWLTLMVDRLDVGKTLMSKTAGIYVNVNDIEDSRLHCAMNSVFGKEGYITTVITKCSTASSFRTVNPGPVDVSDRIVIFAKNKEAYSYQPQPVIKRVDLSHFSRYVVNIDEPPESWRFESIKFRVLNDLGFVCATAKDGVKEARRKLGKAADAIIQARSECFAIEHANAVFETKTFQKPSSWLVDIIEKSKKNPEQIVVAERDGNSPIIMIGGRQFYFLSNNVQIINGVKEVTEPASTIWTDIDTNNLKHEGGVAFSNGKKPLRLLSRIINMSSNGEGRYILDYFGGSGTTAHAVISLNREDGGHRKYILVEMGDHFETVLKPRIQKVVYSPEWKDGKPVSSDKGISHCFKYLSLESYEDTLNNLELTRTAAQQQMMVFGGDEYLLKYMLDLESRGSVISTDDFRKPFDYKLKIAYESSGAAREQKIDLVETFNYLIGLKVEQRIAAYSRGYVYVTGTLPNGESAIVFWRDCDVIDAEKLNTELAKIAVDPAKKAATFDVIYVNGDHAVQNAAVKSGDGAPQFKVRQIENEFLEKMFEEEK